MKTIYTLAIAIAMLLPMCATAQSLPALHTDMTLKYLVKEPAKRTASTPIIIVLHGYGSNEADLFDLAGQLPATAIVLAPRAPITLNATGFAWYPINRPNAGTDDAAAPEKARQQIIRFIAQASKKYNVPTSRIYLLGFSQGAIMSYSIALTEPDKVGGIAVLSGRLREEIKPVIAATERVNKVAIFIGHGTEDKVLPIANGRDAHNYLTGKKIKTEYHEYKIVHTISAEEMGDVNKWLTGALKR